MVISSNIVIPGISEIQEKKIVRKKRKISGWILILIGIVGLILIMVLRWEQMTLVVSSVTGILYLTVCVLCIIIGLSIFIAVGVGKSKDINKAKKYIKDELKKIQTGTYQKDAHSSVTKWQNQLTLCKELSLTPLIKEVKLLLNELRHEGTTQKETSISKLKESIHDLSKVYDDIGLDSLSEKYNLNTSDILPIVEKMIIKGELNAQIRGQFLVFKQKKQDEVKAALEHYDLDRQVNLFISYSHADSELFHISELSEGLTAYDKIDQVVFSQRDVQEDFIQYMNEMLGKSDAILLFCSENSLQSKSVNDEWTAAMAAQKPVVPIFIHESHIPTLIRGKLGVQFNEKNVSESIEEIYAVITKRLGRVKEHLKLD